MTILLLTRHGETFDNVKHIIQGQSQGELNEKGIQQMISLRERLKHEPIHAFVASDLKRSYDSCNILTSSPKKM